MGGRLIALALIQNKSKRKLFRMDVCIEDLLNRSSHRRYSRNPDDDHEAIDDSGDAYHHSFSRDLRVWKDDRSVEQK